MSRRFMIAVAIAFVGIWFCPSYAAADSVPNWDVTTSCRGAAEAGFVQDTATNLKRCIDSEQHTRELLTKDWSSFPASDRTKCVKIQTFSHTYSELATCLEMNRDIRNAAKPAGAMPQRK
jgi:hypothetical protein